MAAGRAGYDTFLIARSYKGGLVSGRSGGAQPPNFIAPCWERPRRCSARSTLPRTRWHVMATTAAASPASLSPSTDLLSLGTDLLALIFQLLDARTDVFSLRCTSRVWDQAVRLAMRSHATLAIAVFDHASTVTAAAVHVFGRLCGHACRELMLREWRYETDRRAGKCMQIPEAVLITFAQRCPNLVRLQLDGVARLTLDGFVEVLKCLPSLELLCLRQCEGLRADEAVYRAAGEHCPSIRRFDIPRKLWGEITWSTHLPKLTYLDLSHLSGPTKYLQAHMSVKPPSLSWNEPAVRATLLGCPAVTSLDLSSHLLDAASLDICCSACPGMRSLCLEEATIMSGSGLIRWLDACPSLTKLDLFRAGLGPNTLSHVARHCPRVVQLNLGGSSPEAVNDKTIKSVCKHMKCLQSLCILQSDGHAPLYVGCECVQHASPRLLLCQQACPRLLLCTRPSWACIARGASHCYHGCILLISITTLSAFRRWARCATRCGCALPR